MERWQGKLAVVTGASSGIGAAVAEELVRSGMIVVGLARRTERIEEIRDNLAINIRSNLHAIQLDVTSEQEIVNVFRQIDEAHGAISILINCAGVFMYGSLLDRENSENLRTVIDTNLFGTVFCVREAYHLMKKHNVVDGHIINMNSILGHKVPYLTKLNILSSYNIYPASKFALSACNEVWRQELIADKCDIKISSIAPGVVRTNFFGRLPRYYIRYFMRSLSPANVADVIIYTLRQPKDVHTQDVVVRTVGEIH